MASTSRERERRTARLARADTHIPTPAAAGGRTRTARHPSHERVRTPPVAAVGDVLPHGAAAVLLTGASLVGLLAAAVGTARWLRHRAVRGAR
jgi:hypothetical protein